MKKRLLVISLVLLAAAGGWWLARLIWFTPLSINHFYERAFMEFALQNPELLSDLRLLDAYHMDFYNDDLTDASDAYAHRMQAMARKDLTILRSYDRSSQTRAQLLSTDILTWYLQDSIDGEKFMYDNYPVNQLSGVQSALPSFMVTVHQVRSEVDARHYITRLSKFGTKFDQVIEGMKIRQKKGVIPPRFVILKVIAEMKNFRKPEPKANILYTNFRDKLEKLQGIPFSRKTTFLKSVEDQIAHSVYPAYDRLIAFMEVQLGKATTDDGVWKFPDGEAFYRYALHTHTTTNMTPDQVHALGLSEVARIEAEMTRILDTEGFHGWRIRDAMAQLAKERRFLYPRTAEGGQAVLRDYQKIIDQVNGGLDGAFNLRPPTGVRVERIPEFKEKTAPTAYYEPPSLEGSRPGVFFVNLRNLADVPKWSMRTLAYHEAIPGHHFQMGIARGLHGLPTFRTVIPFTAYSEGWALYAEKLAWELGFEKDPYDNLGRLQSELFRAVRLVVDTGIHWKRWTREQAIEYMTDHTGMPQAEVVAEVERYIVDPGQACAYKIGELKILQLREKARKALGKKFDLKEFHDVVLRNGAMPLDILEEQVDAWIAASR